MDHAWIVLAIVVASFVLFATEALRSEIVAVSIVLALIISGSLEATKALSCFAAPAPVMVAAMYVFAQAIERWGIADAFGARFFAPGRSEGSLAFRVTIATGVLSTVISDTAVTATMLPVVSAAARRAKIGVSKLLVPLSFGSLLGGMVTVLGTSANIAMNDVLAAAGVPTFGLLEYAPAGLLALVVGAMYFAFGGTRLLPSGRGEESLSEHYQVPRFVTEVLVEPASTLINRSSAELEAFTAEDVTLIGILRDGEPRGMIVPGPYERVRSDDILLLQGEPQALLRLREALGLRERKAAGRPTQRFVSSDVQLVEAVVPAGSPLVGRSLAGAEFRSESGLNALALSKHGQVRPGKIAEVTLGVGDVLLLQGHAGDIERERRRRRLLLLGEFARLPRGPGRVIVPLVLIAVLAAAAANLLPLAVCALAGALVLVLSGCVRAEEALARIDWSVILLVGGLLALGAAFVEHGLGERAAALLMHSDVLARHPRAALGAILLTTVVLTQVTTNVSTVVIMTPVAIALAERLEVSPRPLLVAIALGASCAFMTPMGHAANTMVTGPGSYRFRDFVRVGGPLTLLVCAVLFATIPLLWRF